MTPLWVATLLLAAGPERPSVLVFGTGWGAEGTQASIEAHALALAAVTQPDRLLIGGGPEVRSVQTEGAVDELADLLGLVLDRRDGLHVEYRPPRAPGVGVASKAGLLAALDPLLARGKDTVVFGAGHGSAANDDQAASLELFGPDDQLDVLSLAQHLDQARPKARTIWVLGQCHSGAFADLMHVGGDPKAPLAEPGRCVFAAVPASREAAGCTTDVGHPDARAYLAVFAEALKDQRGDADGDGRVSLTEAHFYALLHDSTVDLPVRSSEVWLERHQRLPALQALGPKDLRGATPVEARVLAKLSAEVPPGTPSAMALALVQAKEEEDRLDEASRAAADAEAQVRRRVSDRLLATFPELTNPFHPVARRLLGPEAAQLKAKILADPELAELQAKAAATAVADEAALKVARRRARLERYEGLARHVAARAKASAKTRAALERLYGCESTAL